MYFTAVAGVDSDAEIDQETDLSKIKFAGVKSRFVHSKERIHSVHRTPAWWAKSTLLGNAEIHVLNLNEDESVKSIRMVDKDTLLRAYEVRL